MYYKVHPDRIILEDENGARVAEIDYPEIRSGLCEITHIYGNDDAEGLRQADNLMDLCVREMRSSGRKVIASSKYASSWFDKHPDAKDILIDASSIDSGIYGEFDLNSRPATFDATATIDTDAVRQAISGTADGSESGSNASNGYTSASTQNVNTGRQTYDDDPEDAEEWDRTDRILRGEIRKKRRRDYKGNDRKYSDRSARPQGTGADSRGRGRQKAVTPLLSVARGMQILSFFVMLAILGTYAASFLLHSQGITNSLAAGNSGRVFIGLSGIFVVFCLIEAVWILTRKNAYTVRTKMKLDPGRGLVAFILILILRFLCHSITYLMPSTTGIFDGFIQFASVFEAFGMVITVLAVIGLILCIIRKILCR